MRKRVFQELLTVVEIEIDEILDYFTSSLIVTKRKFKEMKDCSYGGYEINQCVREFEQNVNLKSTGLLNAVNRIILESNREFTKSQMKVLSEKCCQCFEIIIAQYSNLLFSEFDDIESIKIKLTNKTPSIKYKITQNIQAGHIFAQKRLDKALWWTVGLGISSTILSIVSIIIALIK